jgi:two-component system chemotaxis response regulator CheB
MAAHPSPSRLPRRLVVIGASAGGLAPLRSITSALPADLPATVLVVMHVSSTARSVLPEILARGADVGVAAAYDGLELHPGRVVVAPPDRHLTVHEGRVCLDRGPRENGHRPAVDPLFRSAAEQYGPRCCGVILSGSRDDGTVGLAHIKKRGGLTVVQDPDDAQYDGMPANALAATEVDHVLSAAAIAALLVRFATGALDRRPPEPAPGEADPGQAEILTVLCPECGGTLFADRDAGVQHVHCTVGHRYSAHSLLVAHTESVERAMWTAVRSLEDHATLLRRAEQRGDIDARRSFEEQAQASEVQAQSIRDAVAALDDADVEPLADLDRVSS